LLLFQELITLIISLHLLILLILSDLYIINKINYIDIDFYFLPCFFFTDQSIIRIIKRLYFKNRDLLLHRVTKHYDVHLDKINFCAILKLIYIYRGRWSMECNEVTPRRMSAGRVRMRASLKSRIPSH